MSQPVKLSDALVLDARIAGEAQERSIARQVEFWAKLGRGVELLLGGKQVLALCKSTGAIPLSELVEVADTAKGRKVLTAYLESEPFPHYEPYTGKPGYLIRTKEDGSKVVGKFVNRVFVAYAPETLEQQKQKQPKSRLTRMDELERRATEALRSLLGQVSVIKVKVVRREARGSVFADVDVSGEHRTLACEVISSARTENLRAALSQLNNAYSNDVIPVVIAPHMSPEAQALCKEFKTGFLDLEGNARLTMGKVLISKSAFAPDAPVADAGRALLGSIKRPALPKRDIA